MVAVATEAPIKQPARVKGQKVVVPQAPLAAALGTVARFVDARNPIALLTRICVEYSTTGLLLTGGDHTLMARVSVDCDAETFPPIALDPTLLHKTTLALGDGDVAFEMEKQGMLLLSSGAYRSRLHVLDASTYPPFARINEEAAALSVSVQAFGEALGAVRHAQAKDRANSTPRPELAAVRLRVVAGQLELTACDSYRGAQRRIPADVQSGGWPEGGVVLPARAAAELRSCLAGADHAVTTCALETDGKRLVAHVGPITISSALVQASYPDFDHIIRQTSLVTARIPIKPWLAALEAVSPVTEKEHAPRVKVEHSASTRVSADVAEVGRAEQQFGGCAIEGIETALYRINGKYLTEALESLRPETEVVVSWESPTTSIILRGADDPSRLALVMPMVIGTPEGSQTENTDEKEQW